MVTRRNWNLDLGMVYSWAILLKELPTASGMWNQRILFTHAMLSLMRSVFLLKYLRICAQNIFPKTPNISKLNMNLLITVIMGKIIPENSAHVKFIPRSHQMKGG